MTAGQELLAHLLRLSAASAVWLLVAAAFWLRREPQERGFAVMTVAWAAVDLVIVAASWRGAATTDPERLRWFLWLNEILNFGYVAAGVAMLVRAVRPWWRGAGGAVVAQGLTLLVLDTWLLLRL